MSVHRGMGRPGRCHTGQRSSIPSAAAPFYLDNLRERHTNSTVTKRTTTINAIASASAPENLNGTDTGPTPLVPTIDPSPLPPTPRNKDKDIWTAAAATVYGAACLSTFMAAVGRVSFSVLAVPIQQQFKLSMGDMGLLQSAMLVGYVIGQVPAGMVADRWGGAQTLCGGLIAWSIAVMALAAVPIVPWPLTFILGARAALGLAQSVMMPGVSAAAAQWFPPAQRGSRTSGVYAWYSLGTVTGLCLTPATAAVTGWPTAVLLFGAIGAIWGIIALRSLPLHSTRNSKDGSMDDVSNNNNSTTSDSTKEEIKRIDVGLCWHHAGDLALMCWTHGIIGMGFFVLQSWVPTFLHSLGIVDLTVLGMLSALPWLFTAAVATSAGAVGDWLQSKAGWSALRVRHAMQTAASLGGCLALAPLALGSAGLSPLVATIALCVAVASQGFNYGGYHAYVQDVAPGDAGLILGVTNTFSSVAGIVGNVVAGSLAGSESGFSGVFALAMVLHGLSSVTWLAFARGRQIRLTS